MNSSDVKNLKGKRKLTMLTAYDYPTAKVLNDCDIDMILVGDSLGMVVLGYEDTKSVTIEDMIRHGASVSRGAPDRLVVVDMPIHTYRNASEALVNSRRILDETSASAVKIEGRPDIVRALVSAGIEVMGHTGLKPQEAAKYSLVGKDEDSAALVAKEAFELSEAGAFSVVLECVPSELAFEITERLKIPTIGIGAGVDCDGQVLVISDMIGLYNEMRPRFVRKYANVSQVIKVAVKQFKEDVASGVFPSEGESY